jgi:hypothetical protein
MSDYRIGEISAASPEMSEEESRQLIEDIKRRGQLVPIWKSGDEIIDGRKRLHACKVLGIEPRVVDVSPDQDPADIAHSLNILRTHYTLSQRAMFAAKRATLERGHVRSQMVGKFTHQPQSIEKSAKEAGVAAASVKHAKRVLRNGAPEVSAAVEAGRLTLHSAKRIVRALPVPDQPAAVEHVIAASRGKARNTPARVLGIQNGTNRSPKRPLQGRVERALDQLDNAIESLGAFLAESGATRHRDFAAWLDHLAGARRELVKIIHSHRGGS